MLAEQHDGDTGAHDKNANPSLKADAFAQEQHRPHCTGCVAERRNGNHKAYIFEGQRRQKCEKRYGHHGNADPRPADHQGS